MHVGGVFHEEEEDIPFLAFRSLSVGKLAFSATPFLGGVLSNVWLRRVQTKIFLSSLQIVLRLTGAGFCM